MSQVQRIGRRLAPPILLMIIVSGFYWKLLSQQFTWMDQPDMAYQVLPWYQVQAESWHHGKFPLWDPHIYGGQPLLGQVITGAAYPLNWLLFLMPFKNGHIQFQFLDDYYILTHFMAALFCYWLCRDLGRSRTAAMLGGLGFSLVGLFGTLGWPVMLNGAVWLPLVLLFVFRSMRGERPLSSAAYAGAFLGAAFLSGHHQIPIFVALTAVGLWISHIWNRRGEALKATVVFLGFAALVGGLQILPAIEAGRLSVRWVGAVNDPLSWAQKVPYTIHVNYSVLPLGIVGFLFPSVTEREVFVGLGIILLAAIGVARGFQEIEVKRLIAICAGALVFAMGSLSVFHGVAYLLVPMVEKARSPEMAMVIANIALAVLAAYGLDAVRAGATGGIWVRALCWTGFGALAATVLIASVRHETSREYERLVIFAFVALSLALLLKAWRLLTERSALTILFIVVFFEWGTYVGASFRDYEHPAGFLAQLNQNQDIADFFRGQPNFWRVEVNLEDVPYNFGDWEGIDQRSGYLTSLTANLADEPTEAFSANFYLARKPLNENQNEVFRGRSRLRVFTNPGALPFARAIHESKPCSGDDDVRLAFRDAGHLAATARMACAGTLVISETYFPGWSAVVDGRKQAIRQVAGAVQGVDLQRGIHRVDLVYKPVSVYLGGAMTMTGILGAITLSSGLVQRIRRHQPARLERSLK